MSDDVAYNDLRYYENLTSVPGVTKGYYTGDSSYSIAYLNLLRKEGFTPWDGADLKQLADRQFEQAFAHIDTSNFFIWHETVSGGHVNFITGAGGFLQNVIYGYFGLLADAEGLLLDTPMLPPLGVTALRLRNVHYSGTSFSVSFDNSSMTISMTQGTLDVYTCTSSDEASQLTFMTRLTAAVGEDGDSAVTTSIQKLRLQAVEKKPDANDDDPAATFFKEYYPYFIGGGVFLQCLLVLGVYKYKQGNKGQSDVAGLLSKGQQGNLSDSRL